MLNRRYILKTAVAGAVASLLAPLPPVAPEPFLTSQLDSVAVPVDSKWHNVVMVRNSFDTTYWLDGVEVGNLDGIPLPDMPKSGKFNYSGWVRRDKQLQGSVSGLNFSETFNDRSV